jgi:hypothetical protein
MKRKKYKACIKTCIKAARMGGLSYLEERA